MLHDQGPTPVLPFLPPECAWLAEQSVRSAPPYLSLRLTAPAVWKGPSTQPVSDQQLDCALDLMRRLPPQQIEKNLSDLIDLQSCKAVPQKQSASVARLRFSHIFDRPYVEERGAHRRVLHGEGILKITRLYPGVSSEYVSWGLDD
ncbi:F-actin-capping protein subunit beta [Pteropus alecto]|uniref:F-actin-capping protein subunit beta n=1 Tax=Pteropus alecto TaxID=9402 RepID=L5JUN8_PTEAL|nr:F-actin-capping protein subunit beta [Pteropus alecto]